LEAVLEELEVFQKSDGIRGLQKKAFTVTYAADI